MIGVMLYSDPLRGYWLEQIHGFLDHCRYQLLASVKKNKIDVLIRCQSFGP